jgi:hypothetical protein
MWVMFVMQNMDIRVQTVWFVSSFFPVSLGNARYDLVCMTNGSSEAFEPGIAHGQGTFVFVGADICIRNEFI